MNSRWPLQRVAIVGRPIAIASMYGPPPALAARREHERIGGAVQARHVRDLELLIEHDDPRPLARIALEPASRDEHVDLTPAIGAAGREVRVGLQQQRHIVRRPNSSNQARSRMSQALRPIQENTDRNTKPRRPSTSSGATDGSNSSVSNVSGTLVQLRRRRRRRSRRCEGCARRAPRSRPSGCTARATPPVARRLEHRAPDVPIAAGCRLKRLAPMWATCTKSSGRSRSSSDPSRSALRGGSGEPRRSQVTGLTMTRNPASSRASTAASDPGIDVWVELPAPTDRPARPRRRGRGRAAAPKRSSPKRPKR